MNEWLLRIVGLVIGQISPELRNGMITFVKNLEAQAKKTPNPWDDIFVDILRSVLNIPSGD